jgi:hypothetical protein
MLWNARKTKASRLKPGKQGIERRIERWLARPNAKVPQQDIAIANVGKLRRDQPISGVFVGGQLVA